MNVDDILLKYPLTIYHEKKVIKKMLFIQTIAISCEIFAGGGPSFIITFSQEVHIWLCSKWNNNKRIIKGFMSHCYF